MTHPLKYGILATRSSASMLGFASAFATNHGDPYLFATREEAQAQADKWNARTSTPNVRYRVEEVS